MVTLVYLTLDSYVLRRAYIYILYEEHHYLTLQLSSLFTAMKKKEKKKNMRGRITCVDVSLLDFGH